MLNKLLKRCLPWMDKGRWYKLTVVKSGGNFVVDSDKSDNDMTKAFYGISASGGILHIEFRLPAAGFVVKNVSFDILTSNVFAYAVSAHTCVIEKGDNVVDTLIVCPESGRLIQDIQSADDEFIMYLYAERVIL